MLLLFARIGIVPTLSLIARTGIALTLAALGFLGPDAK